MKRAMAGQAESERERRALNHKRRSRVSGRSKTRAGGIDDFRTADHSATALLTDNEGNFERASHHDHSARAT